MANLGASAGPLRAVPAAGEGAKTEEARLTAAKNFDTFLEYHREEQLKLGEEAPWPAKAKELTELQANSTVLYGRYAHYLCEIYVSEQSGKPLALGTIKAYLGHSGQQMLALHPGASNLRSLGTPLSFMMKITENVERRFFREAFESGESVSESCLCSLPLQCLYPHPTSPVAYPGCGACCLGVHDGNRGVAHARKRPGSQLPEDRAARRFHGCGPRWRAGAHAMECYQARQGD
jgi:hypothetical protein